MYIYRSMNGWFVWCLCRENYAMPVPMDPSWQYGNFSGIQPALELPSCPEEEPRTSQVFLKPWFICQGSQQGNTSGVTSWWLSWVSTHLKNMHLQVKLDHETPRVDYKQHIWNLTRWEGWCTLPETNMTSHLPGSRPQRKRSSSNHPFSGAKLLVSGRVRFGQTKEISTFEFDTTYIDLWYDIFYDVIISYHIISLKSIQRYYISIHYRPLWHQWPRL